MEKEVLKVSLETREAYEAPKCEVMELQMEGVLCASDDAPLPPPFEGDDGYHEGGKTRWRN